MNSPLLSRLVCSLQSIRQTRRERLRVTQANTKSRQKGNQIESANLSGEKQRANETKEKAESTKEGEKKQGFN